MPDGPPKIWLDPFTSEQEVYLWMLFYGLAMDDERLMEQALVQILDCCPVTQYAQTRMMKRGYRAYRPSKGKAFLR